MMLILIELTGRGQQVRVEWNGVERQLSERVRVRLIGQQQQQQRSSQQASR